MIHEINKENQADFWRGIVDNAPTMLWCIDQQGVPVYYNQQWLKFSGVGHDDDVGDAWFSKLHPDDRDSVMASTGNALDQRKSIRIEYRFKRFDGQYRNVLDMGEPQFDADGGFIGYIGSTVDITEQRQDAQQLYATNQQLNRSAKEIRLLNEFNDHLQVCKEIDETLPILKRYGRQLFPDASVSICLISESRNIVEPFVGWGDEATLNRMFSPDDCWALRRGKVHVESPCQDGSLCPNTRNCKIKFGYVCIPMMAYGEVLGVLNMCYNSAQGQSDEFKIMNQRLAQITADQVALAIANLKLRETLEHQSTRDPLTQLYNRRFLLDNMEREFCRAIRDGQSIGAMMLDVDHFKRFNDSYGHEAGDLVLREMGQLLRDSVRDMDLPCRYGGEEFLIVLTDSSQEVTLARAEAIREKISTLIIEYGKQPLGQITVSIGVANYPGDADSIDKLISRADHALYKAKANGRNQVVSFRSADPSPISDAVPFVIATDPAVISTVPQES